ncbi:OadG family protein [Lutibacter sp. B2]|nr:OadG family protein [Lutibacter sp. B2]
MSLLDRFADPKLIKGMPMGDKLMASLQVTILGMLVTFVVLMLLWGLIVIMTKVLTRKPKVKPVVTETTPAVQDQAVEEEDDEELVAVITAAIAASLSTSTHNLIVTNIVRVEDATPAWGKVGRIDQMNSRF